MPMLDTLYIFDMDRCTMNTDAIMLHLEKVLETFGIDHKDAENERKFTVDSPTLNVWEHLKTVILPRYDVDVSEVSKAFLATAPDESFLYPGARQLLQEFAGKTFVMTFGARDWQLMKAKLCGIDQLAPVLIVDTHEKASLIAAAQQADNSFVFEVDGNTFSAKSVVLVDDKADAFKGLPDNCRGYQINNGEWFWFQEGELPANAQRLDNFEQFKEREK